MDPGDAADALVSLLLQAGHAPSDPAERALLWMLSGQFARYQELDVDGTLLAQARLPLRCRCIWQVFGEWHL